MHHAPNLARRAVSALEHLPRADQRAAGRIIRCGAFLENGGTPRNGVMQDDVGEGATDINAEGKCH